MTAALARLTAPLAPRRPESLRPVAFELPPALSATEPPEARGLARDGVRLMVSRAYDDAVRHARFRDLPDFLAPGDLVVVNESATINASLDAWRLRAGGELADRIELHLSTRRGWRAEGGGRGDEPVEHWVVELRGLTHDGTAPLLDARAGETIMLAAGATATLIEPLETAGRNVLRPPPPAPRPPARLWVAELACPDGVMSFAARYGRPIRYSYVRGSWPLSYYQTVFATEPGSAEMPSAGRAFTREIVERLARKGVRTAPLVLHTGVASLESDEPPYPERFRVPAATADAVNRAHARGGRVVAVGTTVARALESVASPGGRVRAGEGWTDLVVTPERGMYTVDAMLTGLHEPRSSHLSMLEALAGRRHLVRAYEAALRCHYLWHEFGDLHLIVAKPRP